MVMAWPSSSWRGLAMALAAYLEVVEERDLLEGRMPVRVLREGLCGAAVCALVSMTFRRRRHEGARKSRNSGVGVWRVRRCGPGRQDVRDALAHVDRVKVRRQRSGRIVDAMAGL